MFEKPSSVIILLGWNLEHFLASCTTLAIPTGVCHTVGVGGHFSGGGYDNLIWKYGLSVDKIVDAKITGIDGKIMDRKIMGEDLFWAIRGGSGASFGVILSWKIKLVLVPEIVTIFVVDKTTKQGLIDLIYKYQNVATKLPDDLFLRIELSEPGVYKKTIKVTLIGFFLGKIKGLLKVLEKHLPELGLTPHYCTEMKWIEYVLFWNAIPTGTSIDILLERVWYGRSYTKSKSNFIKNTILKQGLERIIEKLVKSGDITMHWNPYGGCMDEISEHAVPLPQRSGY
ncbi:berberine bridge enzyme-like 5 [Apium graveolens]|uniref:berberine bridge enzyme-like 5 n=1 Tax=Apium graveolens TaxID=4045 RepID=UPI003D7B4216